MKILFILLFSMTLFANEGDGANQALLNLINVNTENNCYQAYVTHHQKFKNTKLPDSLIESAKGKYFSYLIKPISKPENDKLLFGFKFLETIANPNMNHYPSGPLYLASDPFSSRNYGHFQHQIIFGDKERKLDISEDKIHEVLKLKSKLSLVDNRIKSCTDRQFINLLAISQKIYFIKYTKDWAYVLYSPSSVESFEVKEISLASKDRAIDILKSLVLSDEYQKYKTHPYSKSIMCLYSLNLGEDKDRVFKELDCSK